MFRPRKDKFTDEKILADLRQDKVTRAQALSYLYKAYQRMVYEMVLKDGGTEDEARGVLHEGLIRLEGAVRKGAFRGDAKLSTYFHTICSNFWNRTKQKHNPSHLSSSHESTIQDDSKNVLQRLQQEDFRNQVQKIIGQLSLRCYQLLLWTDGEGNPMKEVAAKLGFESVQVARNQKTRCRKKLREMIASTPAFRTLVLELLETTDLEEKSWK